MGSNKIPNSYAAMSGKIVQNIFVAQNRLSGTQYRRDCCAPYTCNSLPFCGGKLAWTSISSMQMHKLPQYQRGFVNRGNVYCNGLFQTLIIQVDIKSSNCILNSYEYIPVSLIVMIHQHISVFNLFLCIYFSSCHDRLRCGVALTLVFNFESHKVFIFLYFALKSFFWDSSCSCFIHNCNTTS